MPEASAHQRFQGTGQYLFGILFVALPCTLALLHLIPMIPVDNYNDSMERGQYQQARQRLSPEVERGNPQARNALANLYYLGLGVEQDYRQAAALYHAAAAQGLAAAQLNLGHLYNQGLGVRKDTERAFGWYVHADIADSPWAEYYLSQLSTELTLTPLQMQSLKARWQKLDHLVAEPL